ncbi:MAG: acyl carrier protein [Ruminococcus sp.]|nr:acyl carrier protein [Ruminococcus sp.]
MTHDEVMAKLNEIFQDVFDDDTITVYDDTTADDIDDWDSLEHINLIEAVEHEFDMKFRMQEVSDMKDVGEMADIVVERAGTKK